MDPLIPAVFKLSPEEKLQLVEDLWDDLASTPEVVPIHDWQKEELDKRKERLRHCPDSGRAWEDVMRRVRGKSSWKQ